MLEKSLDLTAYDPPAGGEFLSASDCLQLGANICFYVMPDTDPASPISLKNTADSLLSFSVSSEWEIAGRASDDSAFQIKFLSQFSIQRLQVLRTLSGWFKHLSITSLKLMIIPNKQEYRRMRHN